MRIDSIDLVRYGHFSNTQVELPARRPDYYLIYGDNEAGKSTLLRGISALLFGVPAKTPDVHSCKSSELRIGATISDDRNRFSFRRRKGTSGTLLNLLDGQIPDDSLDPFLRELDRERFDQFFGLTHQSLREGGEELLRGKGDIGSALFQAAGLLDLRRLLETVDDQAKELFSPKSRTKTISRAIEEYKQAKSEGRKSRISETTVKQTQAELAATKEALEKLKDESHSLREELERLKRIESNKPDLARLHELRTALAALEAVPVLPADVRRQRDEAARTLSDANSQIGTLTQDISQRENRIQELPANSLFKAHEEEIEELNTGTSGYIQSVTDRTKRLRERDDAIQLAEAGWKGVWSRPVTEAENLKSAYSAKEEILKLIAEHKGLIAGLTNAEEELRTVKEDQERLQEELAQKPAPPDPAGLVATVEHAKSLGETDQAAARLAFDIKRLTSDAGREMRKLREWSGSIEQLENLKTPLLTTIDQYAREWENAAATRKDLSTDHASALDTIRRKQGELDRLTSQIADVGEGELAEVRARRDQLWQLIRASAFDKTITGGDAQKRSGSSAPVADIFAQHVHRADEIADLRFANAKDVAIHDRLVKEIDAARGEQQQIEARLAQVETGEGELRGRWTREWSALGSTPLSPIEMKEWMQLRQSILDQVEQSREKENELHSLEGRSAAAAAQITTHLAALGSQATSDGQSLPVLIKVAEAFTREVEKERRRVDDIRRRLQLLSVEKRQTKLEECKTRLAEWSRKWSPHVSALLLPEASVPDQVARALVVLEKVLDQLKDADRLQYRVKRIGDNIETFEKRVSQLVAALDPSYATLSADAAVKQLHSRLVELGHAETVRKALQEQNDRDKAAVAIYLGKVNVASAALSALKELANCEDDQQLEATITAAEQKSDKQEAYDRIAAGLIERNAIADLAHIEHEASAYDLDSLRPEIASKANRLKASLDDISLAASRHGELTSEFERLEGSEESALQAQKAEEAMAQLRPAVAQYLRLKLASEVLQQAIESYREKHQGPILKRASELFAHLTLGRHSGLISDFGADDRPILVAIRRNGERVHVEGLSDGTRDQLYLALRLAAIEHHVETVTPCPVIFDDLLINSDDPRSSAALEVVGDLATRTQVLFFTHHRRLAELGIKAGAHVIELGALTAAAIA